MIFTAFDGHGTSGIASPSTVASGLPTVCAAGTHSVSEPIAASAAEPILVITRVESTT